MMDVVMREFPYSMWYVENHAYVLYSMVFGGKNIIVCDELIADVLPS